MAVLKTLSRLPTLCYLVPTIVLIGAVPQFYFMWFVWRLMSSLLPSWVYQVGDDWIFATYQRLILFFFEHCTGVQIMLHGDAAEVIKRPERVLYLANHQSTLDWIVVDMLAVRQGSLGRPRYVMKDGLQFLPVYGFYFYQHGCIYVRRGKFNADKMMKGLDYLNNASISNWLIIFPEGTRFNPKAKDVIEKSRTYAKEQGLTELQHLLTPRSTGLYLTLEKLKQHFDAVYDVTVLYDNTQDKVTGQRLRAPQMCEFLTGKFCKIHIHVNRIPISSVPTTKDALQKWLHKMYVHKDKLISKFYEPHGADDNPVLCLGKGTNSCLSLWHTLPYLLVVFSVHVPLLSFQFGRTLYWKLWLFSTVGGYVWLAIRSVA